MQQHQENIAMTGSLDAPALVESVIDHLNRAYIFPDRAAAAAVLLRSQLEKGRYQGAAGEALLLLVNEDLLEACSDKHLRLLWYEADASGAAPQSDEDVIALLREMFRLENHGVKRVERLAGNIGIIELTVIPDAASAGRVIAAAFELVQHTSGLILDLRPARGGSPDGVAYLCSFFFADSDVHLTDIVEGPNGPTHQFWTSGYLPAPRYLERPVYALVSGTTFSGGEALAYDLQAHRRATIVGDVTRGGAHPSTVVSLGENIELRLPIARSVSPVTGGDWDGVGVIPDIAVPAADAFDTAYRALLDAVLADAGSPESVREEARQALLGTHAAAKPV
jgi:C-terminal processing protease CtpA/Prc